MKKILLSTLLFSSFAFADATTADDKLIHHFGADAASQITFDSGRANLTDTEISALNDLVAQSQMDSGKIDEVKVYVWGDKIYPQVAGNAATREEKKIADQRLRNIKNYLKNDLKIRDVQTFNMAREAHDADSVAQVMTPSGSVSSNTVDFAKASPSEALVLVYKK